MDKIQERLMRLVSRLQTEKNIVIDGSITSQEMQGFLGGEAHEINEIIKELSNNKDAGTLDWREVMGWMYADACTTIDRGEDYRKIEFPSIVERAKKDLVTKAMKEAKR